MGRIVMISSLTTLSAVAGCSAGFDSEGGQLHFEPIGVMTGPVDGFRPENPILAGSTVCMAISANDSTFPQGEDVGDCFHQRVLGAGTLDRDDCVTVDDAGEVEWWLEAIDCPANDAGYAPVDDYVHYTGVGVSAVEASMPWWIESFSQKYLEPASSWPTDWTLEDEPFSVLAGSILHLPIVFTHPDYDSDVAWVPDEAALDVEQTGTVDVEYAWSDTGWLDVQVPEDSAATLSLTLHGHTWVVGSVEAVLADDVDTMQVVAGYWPGDEDGLRLPFGARAVLWTTDGRPVLGAPVEWRVTKGALAFQPSDLLSGPDYTMLSTDCVPPSEHVGTERARIEARWHGLKDDADLRWVTRYEPDPSWETNDPDEGWTAAPECQEGCGCSATLRRGAGGPLALVAGLFGLALRRRRATGRC